MKEFLFRYRKHLILLATIIILNLVCLFLYINYDEVVGQVFIAPLGIGYFIAIALFSDRQQETGEYNEWDRHFSSYSPNYINGKCIAIISFNILGEYRISDKAFKFYTKVMDDEFIERNNRFYLENQHIFLAKKHNLKWATEKLRPKSTNKAKIQLLDFLIRIATADKFLSIEELSTLRKVCKYLRLNYRTLNAILARHNYANEEDQQKQQQVKRYKTNDYEKYYNLLELDKTASLQEVKTAYRNLVKIYHPDKQTGKKTDENWAKKRFQEIQEAYDKINKK